MSNKFIGVATHTVSYPGFGGFIIHEVYDGNDCFKHRLIYVEPEGKRIEGMWVAYEAFARLSFECSNCSTQHVFMACQDNWQPMFPPVFSLLIPNADKLPLEQYEAFENFLTMPNDVGMG